IGDNRQRIAQAVRGALSRADGAIMTGGLGPTVDDLTRDGVCDALGLDTELYEPAIVQMEKAFAVLGRPMRPNNRKQAELPHGSKPLDNPNGTAPGFIAFAADGKFVACMPGVPREMKPMMAEKVLPFVRDRLGSDDGIYTRVLHTIAIGESDIDHRIADLFRSSENPKIAVLAHDYRADVKIMAKASSRARADAMIAPLQLELERRLEGFIFGCDAETPASVILALLQSRGRMLAVAESFTGGRVAAALTSVPGASQSFAGGVVAYANAAKVSLLGITAATLERAGAVSEETAREMARGARERFDADVALATTGIAGPSGGTREKPVGLGWLAVDDAESGLQMRRVALSGDRETIASRATTIALGMLWQQLRSQSS
ncbi:MAG TPA: CinA family nicotinamide mononucleotide deamidase-related protein, partial [Candidatus Cybelea sp.]